VSCRTGRSDGRTLLDGQWVGEGKRKTNVILAFYERTHLIWVGLVLVDLVAQGLKTANSSDEMLELLRRS
jgi:hypothetical protein